jgi:hypothetical protein
MAKLPNPFGKAKTVPMPQPTKPTKEEGGAQLAAGIALQKFGAKGPLAPKGKTPTPTPAGGYKPGMSGQQYKGEQLKDYSAMKPKLATKDKVLNPIKKAVGLPGKPAKMVPKKPGQN